MKQSLSLKLGQQLAMTPQLQQAIRLLQLSTLDLATEIQQAIEGNPMLEMVEESDDVAPVGESGDAEAPVDVSVTQTVSVDDVEDPSSINDQDYQESIPSELPVDSSWDDIYPTAPTSGSSIDSSRRRSSTRSTRTGC
jgi:RNA polymerase sigma-54 factor